MTRVTSFSGLLSGGAFRGASIMLFCACLLSSLQNAKQATPEDQSGTSGAAALITRAAANEVAALQAPEPFRYFETLQWKWGTETRDVIETPEGRADRIVKFNSQPLAPDQEEKQQGRLEKLLSDPKAARHEIEDQQSEMKRRIVLMRAFPTAFIFTPDGEEDGKLKFTFRPTGSFSPRDRESQVYRGMEGTVWVEPRQERLTRIDGTLTKNVSFGWGVLGKLYKGGRYQIEQTEVQPGRWQVTRLDLDLKMRIFFGTSRLLRKERATGFKAVPADITYNRALKLLLRATNGPDR